MPVVRSSALFGATCSARARCSVPASSTAESGTAALVDRRQASIELRAVMNQACGAVGALVAHCPTPPAPPDVTSSGAVTARSKTCT